MIPETPANGAASLESFIARVRAGDTSAFDEIVRRYEGLVLRVARRMTGNREDSLDAAQETFLRIYRSLGRFQTGRRFEAWVYRIVVRASLDLIRRRGQVELLSLDPRDESGGAEEPRSRRSSPEDEAGRSQLRERLDRVLGELSPRLRAVFVLRDIEGLETAEIARILRCREVTVRRHSMEARERVRGLLRRRHPGLAPGERPR